MLIAVDSLLITIWFQLHHVIAMIALAVPESKMDILQGRFLGLQVKITWATRFLKLSCKETNRLSLGYRKSFLLSQGSWSFGFELQRFVNDKVAAGGYRQVKVLEFFDCPGPRQGVEDLRELLHKGAQEDRKAEIFQSGLSKVFWADDTTRSRYLVNRSPSSVIGFKKPIDMLGFFGWLASIKQGMLELVVPYRNMGFNESGEYKKTFIGSGVGECRSRSWFKRSTNSRFDGYLVARYRKQTLACELFGYRDDNNEVAFVVAAVEKIYAHESLTFNNTVVCEVIYKWKAGLKDDMDARSDVYVLSNGCRKCSDDNDGYYWYYTPGLLVLAKRNILGLEIIKDQSGDTLRSLEDSLLEDCDVEKNGFVDFDYIMRRSITVMSRSITGYRSILGCAGSLKAYLQHMEALSTTEAGYMTFTEG
ncbi:hypothetical protein Tco_1054442 [Tanacetum coccineum]|uniref:Zinc finger, CCHC-type n=1 Tax=Tanacetum coccineum TaxID=301880 RepID=A0ABQ5GYB2_9ASTR